MSSETLPDADDLSEYGTCHGALMDGGIATTEGVAADMEAYFANQLLNGLIGLIRVLTAPQFPKATAEDDFLNGQPVQGALHVTRCPSPPLVADLPGEDGGTE